jgi:hypothetical protein
LISISDALPESSNVKMVEVWMLFTLVLPFLEVVLQSYVDYIYRKSHPDEEDTSRPPPAVRAEAKLQPRREGTGLWKLPADPPAAASSRQANCTSRKKKRKKERQKVCRASVHFFR